MTRAPGQSLSAQCSGGGVWHTTPPSSRGACFAYPIAAIVPVSSTSEIKGCSFKVSLSTGRPVREYYTFARLRYRRPPATGDNEHSDANQPARGRTGRQADRRAAVRHCRRAVLREGIRLHDDARDCGGRPYPAGLSLLSRRQQGGSSASDLRLFAGTAFFGCAGG